MKNRSCDEVGKVAEAGRRLGCPMGRKWPNAPLRSAAGAFQGSIEHDHEGFSLDEGFSSNRRKILRDHEKRRAAVET
jgi:hypothetical protein